MSPSIRNRTKIERKKYNINLKTSLKRVLKTLFSSFRILLVVILLAVVAFAARPLFKSLSSRDFSFLTAAAMDKVSSQELFVKPVNNFVSESPEMTFVQENSMVGVSSPAMASSQVLGSIAEKAEPSSPENNDLDIIEYAVEKGDTLSSVASKFSVSLDTILWANNLSSKSIINPGQKLLILPVSGAIHLVNKGDTLEAIAEKYEADVEKIIAFNSLSGEGDIFIGDVLIIPGGTMPLKIAAAPKPSTPSSSGAINVPVANSYFIFPCEGKISQGPHGAFGNAIDISNKCGKPIVAAAGGKIQRAGYINIGGKIITILHPNGVVTYYGHLSTILVTPGQTVTAGEIIGYIGNTGYTIGITGCHLHFEVRGANNFLAKYPVGSAISWNK